MNDMEVAVKQQNSIKGLKTSNKQQKGGEKGINIESPPE